MGNFIKKISEILNQLKEIKNKFREIPQHRILTCIIEEIQINPPTWIYKPRFKPKNKPIPQNLKMNFIQLIDNINLHLKKYSPDNFANLIDILDVSGNNKKSIIFLLENNVYNTDEVFGDYFVEKFQDHYEINYYRWNKKKNQLPNEELTIDLGEIVMNDAIIQIQNQFDQLWKTIENEIERCSSYYQSQKELKYEERISIIKKLLETKECEYLDFKIAMYDLFSKNLRTKWEQRNEFLKDVLGLINNKNIENSKGQAYIVIGVGEENEKYNGTHRNIDFTNNGTIIQLVNEYIAPKFDIKIEEYYISGNRDNILISMQSFKGYDRNLIIKLFYDVGAVYEIKKRSGNPDFNVEYYREGTSFTRDGSITRRMMQEDRKKIISIKDTQQTLKTKRFNQFFKVIAEIFNRMVEIENPKGDSNFNDNRNYLYCKYSLKTEDGLNFLDNNDSKHLIIKLAELLKKLYLSVGYFSSNEDVNKFIYGNYLKFYESRIKIEVNKISIPRSSEDMISKPINLKNVITYILSEIEAIAIEHNLDYEKIKMKYIEGHNTKESLKRPNIRLIEMYLEFIDDTEISPEDLYDRYNRVSWEVSQYRNLRNINKQEKEIGIKTIQSICKVLLKQTDPNILSKFLEILYYLSKIEIFISPLESYCLNTFVQFYKDKKYERYVFDLLDTLGYFTNIEKEIFQAIADRDYNLLKRFGSLKFTAYDKDGLTLVKKLQSKLKEINDSEDNKLKESIRKIIINIEKIIFS